MKRKKYLKIVIGFIVISIIIIFIYFNDKRIYSEIFNLIDEEEINITSFTYNNNEVITVKIDDCENATYIKVNNVGYVVDNNELFRILSKYKCKKSKIKYFPYSRNDVDIVTEISITQNHRPKHILLGDFYIWYESADKKPYAIIDGNKLLEEILLLVENKNVE